MDICNLKNHLKRRRLKTKVKVNNKKIMVRPSKKTCRILLSFKNKNNKIKPIMNLKNKRKLRKKQIKNNRTIKTKKMKIKMQKIKNNNDRIKIIIYIFILFFNFYYKAFIFYFI